MHKTGVIDMGTNTFHLLVAEVGPGTFVPLDEYKRGVRLGKGGISDGKLAEDSMARALDCLRFFRDKAVSHGLNPASVEGYATSAVRSASNGPEFVEQIKAETGFVIQTIGGEEEAGLIFDGVRASGVMEDQTVPVIVMDIGGGSVEFILGTREGQIHWKQSFEIGGQRLVDAYMQQDPIQPSEAMRLKDDMRQRLVPLAEACRKNRPGLLVGASGTFDTLRVIERPGDDVSAITGKPWSELDMTKTSETTSLMQTLTRAERLAIPGVSELRADMIVVALLLLEVALELTGARCLRQCSWALKEGAAWRLAQRLQ